jgi:UDP-2,3-diacylglucosamine hydrolase
VAKLERLRSRKIPITFVGGNHDRWGGDFLREDLGIAFHAGMAELDIAGRRAFVAHGDGVAEQHWSATLMHRVTRHPATVAAFRALHPSIGFWIADRLSVHLADDTRDPAVLERAARAQAAFAREMLQQRADLSLVILAHTHRAVLETLPDRRAYLNPGAWMEGQRYAVVTRESVELKSFG